MKKSDIERQLKRELRDAAPSDFDSVWKKCSSEQSARKTEKETVPAFVPAFVGSDGSAVSGNPRGTGKRLLAILLAAALLFSGVLFAVLWNVFAQKDPGFVFPGSDGYFIFDINPSVELAYDKKGRVTGAQGLNDDGEALIYGLTLEGRTYDEAANVLFERCMKLGYFSASREDNAVLVSANLSEGGRDETMTSEMKKLLAEEFSFNKIRGVVITGIEDPALQSEARKYGIDAQKYALILSYLALGGKLEESEYSSVTVRELYAGISERQTEKKNKEIKELEKQTAEMEEELFEMLSENIQDIIEELGECIDRLYKDGESKENDERREMYENRMKKLEKYADDMEEADSADEFGRLAKKILLSLKDMSENEPDAVLKQLLDSVYIQVENISDSLEVLLKELRELTLSAEELSSARFEKFGDSEGGDEEFDFDEWQDEKEKQLSSSWYDFKKQWEAARKHDLDD